MQIFFANMFGLLQILIFININYMLIECIVPGTQPKLRVVKLDNKLIERKRQDTMDMCRIFTEETQKLNIINKNKYFKTQRAKRSIGQQVLNPTLNLADAQRVESIVDKMYDDLQEQGEKIDYKRGDLSPFMNNISDTSKEAVPTASRKFNFAPALIMGPKATEAPVKHVPSATAPELKKPRFLYGIVPYFIDSKTYDTHLSEVIMKAFDYFEKVTCIRLQRLRERPTDKESLQEVEWLYITNPTGIKQCVHSNDRAEIKGVQMIVFGYDCMSLGDIAHEVMHVLGFPHEHIRPDRDHYISILWDNIKPGYKKYFELLKKPPVDNLPYDYASVLHYPSRAFSRNGQVTIMTQPGIKIGQREGLSEIDVEKISAVYSRQCVNRNREYLLKTCPSVVKNRAESKPVNVTKKEIEKYYKGKLWTYGIVNYRLRDKFEFSNDERENINAVIRHIEKETCIEFRDLTNDATLDVEEESSEESSAKTLQAEVSDGTGVEREKNKISELSDNRLSQNGDRVNDDAESDQPKTGDDNQNNVSSAVAKDYSVDTDFKGLDTVIDSGSSSAAKREGKTFLRRKKSIHLIGLSNNNKTHIHASSSNTTGPKKKQIPVSPSRRHATNILILTRSANPGCACPKSGIPGTATVIEINADCFNSVNDLLHLFVHILGLDHQHNSHDRDSYLHIMWDQLTDKIRKDMKKILPPAASVGFQYDYQSVMHYPWLQIKNGRTNIMYPIWNDGWAMGHWQGLSSIDVQKLNLLYYKQCVLRRQLADEAELRMVTAK